MTIPRKYLKHMSHIGNNSVSQ